MRMWGVPTNVLCTKHLLGEHVEMHMFIGTLKKGISILGYIQNGLVNPAKIIERHNLLAEELKKRGMNHNSPLEYDKELPTHSMNIVSNFAELVNRCPLCFERSRV